MISDVKFLIPPKTGVCAYMGNAQSPAQHAASGRAFANSYIAPIDSDNGIGLLVGGLLDLSSKFHKGGSLDAQVRAVGGDDLRGSSYGNYTYGVFFAAAGFSKDEAVAPANLYGYIQRTFHGSYKDRSFGKYGGIPMRMSTIS